MFRRRNLTAVVVATVAASLLTSMAWFGQANAAQTATVGGNALKVSPVRMDVKMDPGTKQTVSLFIQNISNTPANLRAAINDFVAAGDESGKPNIILNENEYAPSHSLKRLVSPISDFTVGAGENKEIKVTITVPKNAAGGGYYGAVRFQPAGKNTKETLSLSASVGSLVLLKVNGDVKEDMTVESLDIRQKDKPGSFFTSSKALTAVVRFKNQGNVHVEPFGKLAITRFGKTVGSYEINNTNPRGNVLPDSIRRFDTSLKNLGAFGKYTVKGNFGYGSAGQLLTAETTFYVIPTTLLLAGVGILLILLFLIFVLPRMIRAYNRRVIKRASRRRY